MMSLSKKLPLPWENLGLHLIHGSFIGPNQVHNPNGVLIGSSALAQLTVVINTRTLSDRETSAAVGRLTMLHNKLLH